MLVYDILMMYVFGQMKVFLVNRFECGWYGIKCFNDVWISEVREHAMLMHMKMVWFGYWLRLNLWS